MQNNVTYLSRKLQRSLDNNYNVVDMPAVIEIISTLEKTAVTKELLETTRLGKYINELRRKTSNESLAKRGKDLLKRWRDLILPDAAAANNGQVRSASANSGSTERADSPAALVRPPPAAKKRPASSTPPDTRAPKRSTAPPPPLNGQCRELDFSDSSNCSVKEQLRKSDVIFINSDSNSSLPDATGAASGAAALANAAAGGMDAEPKRRGRKKGSKNHKNLVIAAEESFTNKMAVSRHSKVKTTQELLADLQSRAGPNHDIQLRAAQLTENLSRIEQKLNPQRQINKNVTPMRYNNNNKARGPSVDADVVLVPSDDEEIVDVVGTDPPEPLQLEEQRAVAPCSEPLTIEGLMAQLPPIDVSCLDEPDDIPPCECPPPPVAELSAELKLQLQQQQQQEGDRITVQIVGDCGSLFAPSPSPEPEVEVDAVTTNTVPERTSPTPRHEDTDNDAVAAVAAAVVVNCAARDFLHDRYLAGDVSEARVFAVREQCAPNVNGNWGQAGDAPPAAPFADIVPSYASERLMQPRAPCENFQRYSISEAGPGGGDDFREWHETLNVASYNGDTLRILPYVIID